MIEKSSIRVLSRIVFHSSEIYLREKQRDSIRDVHFVYRIILQVYFYTTEYLFNHINASDEITNQFCLLQQDISCNVIFYVRDILL